MNTTTNNTTTIANATTLSALANAPFTYKKKDASGEYQVLSTTMLAENFNRLPDSKTFKESCVYNYIHDMYINATHYTTVKGDNQRKKYADKLAASVKAWAKFVGISENDLTGLYMACGLKKSTSKGVVDSALPSESTFTKSMLYVSYTRINKGVWQTKPVKTSESTSKTVKSFDDLVTIYIENFGFSPETAKSLAEKARQAKAQVGKVA